MIQVTAFVPFLPVVLSHSQVSPIQYTHTQYRCFCFWPHHMACSILDP